MEMELGESSAIGGQNESTKLPLGFRFDPLPRELVFYLKLKNSDFTPTIKIPEVDLYKIHPKRLTAEIDSSFGIYGNGRYYYFTKRKRREQGGSRVIRSMNEGYWKTTSKDIDVTDNTNKKIGYRKTFKFFEFEGDDKKPTNWIMHEFRDLNTKSVMVMDSVMDASTSNENSDRIEHYVLCMIYEKRKECPTNYPPSTQAIMNMGVDAEEVRESSIPQNQSNASHPHEANLLMPNIDQFPLPLEFIDHEVLGHLIEPDGENMHLDFPDTNPSHPHEADSMSRDPSGNLNPPESTRPIPGPSDYSNGFSTSHDASGNQNRPESIPSIPWNSNPMNQFQTQSDNKYFVEDPIMQPAESFPSDSIPLMIPRPPGYSNGFSMSHDASGNQTRPELIPSIPWNSNPMNQSQTQSDNNNFVGDPIMQPAESFPSDSILLTIPRPLDYSNGFSMSHDVSGNQNRPEPIPSIPWNSNPMNQSQTQSDHIMQPAESFPSDSILLTIPRPLDYSNGFSTSHYASGNQNRPEPIPSIPWNSNPMNQSQTQSDNNNFVEDHIMQPAESYPFDSILLTIPRPLDYSNGFSTSHYASGNQNHPEPIPSIPWNSNPMNQSQTQSDNNNFAEDPITQPTFPTSEDLLSELDRPIPSPLHSYSNDYSYMMDGISNGIPIIYLEI